MRLMDRKCGVIFWIVRNWQNNAIIGPSSDIDEDDEHGWANTGILILGWMLCKTINLSPDAEPEFFLQ